MKIDRLTNMRTAFAEVFIEGRVMVVKSMEGPTFFALNHHSENPYNLRYKHERAAWARATGHTQKEVEAYIRRREGEEEHYREVDELRDAMLTVKAAGYVVADINGNPVDLPELPIFEGDL